MPIECSWRVIEFMTFFTRIIFNYSCGHRPATSCRNRPSIASYPTNHHVIIAALDPFLPNANCDLRENEKKNDNEKKVMNI